MWQKLTFMALAAYILLGLGLTTFHGDESTLIYMGRDSAYLLSGQIERLLYSSEPESPTEQHLRLLNGTLPKSAYGLLNLLGGQDLATWNEQWDWGGDWAYNLQSNRLPADGILLAARWLSALALIVALAAFYASARLLLNGWAALMALLLFGLNAAVLLNGRRAMMESWMLAGSLLVVWVGLRLARRPQDGRALLLLGLFSGLAIASKHTAAFSVVAVYGGLGFVGLLRPWPQRGRALLGLLTSGLLALALFVLLNPAWWNDPLGRPATVFALRSELLSGQVAAFGGYTDLGQQALGFLRQGFWPVPQHYEVSQWADFIGAQIRTYEASPWAGAALPLPLIAQGGLLALCAYGLLRLLRRWREPVIIVALAWMSVALLLVVLLTPLEWQRYYLPFHPVAALCAACGLAHLWPSAGEKRSPHA